MRRERLGEDHKKTHLNRVPFHPAIWGGDRKLLVKYQHPNRTHKPHRGGPRPPAVAVGVHTEAAVAPAATPQITGRILLCGAETRSRGRAAGPRLSSSGLRCLRADR
jgi:hypothetical protein